MEQLTKDLIAVGFPEDIVVKCKYRTDKYPDCVFVSVKALEESWIFLIQDDGNWVKSIIEECIYGASTPDVKEFTDEDRATMERNAASRPF